MVLTGDGIAASAAVVDGAAVADGEERQASNAPRVTNSAPVRPSLYSEIAQDFSDGFHRVTALITGTEHYHGALPQLNRVFFIDRLKIEEKLRRKGLRLVHFYITITLFIFTLATYDPISSIADVHRALAGRFDSSQLDTIADVDAVMNYCAFFIDATYKLASAMVDTNTFDSIDVYRCLDSQVIDICQLTYWDKPLFNLSDPTRPIVLQSRLQYPTPMVVPLSPLVWQTRSRRVPCSGFGSVYNQEVLGAGRCSKQGLCPNGTPLSTFYSNGTTFHISYTEDAFFCVDPHQPAHEFWDNSWHPGASWEDLNGAGREIKPRPMGGEQVFHKFVSNVGYLQAPIDLLVNGTYILQNDSMWGDPYVRDNQKRADWALEYIANTSSSSRKNTFVTIETRTLTIMTIVISPQGKEMPDVTTIVMVVFKFTPYGRIDAEMQFQSTSQTTLGWKALAKVFWAVALLGVVDNFVRHVRHWNDPVITLPKWLRVSDVVLPLAAIGDVIALYVVDARPPHVDEEFREAFAADEQEKYFEVVGHIIEYSFAHERLRYSGFVILTSFVLRGLLQLELHPKFALLLSALNRAGPDISHTFLACGPIFLIISFQAWWMFADNPTVSDFESPGQALRTTMGYAIPSIPSSFGNQGTGMFIMWGLLGIFALRLFYLVTIACIVKAFMDAKQHANEDVVERDILADSFDVMRMSLAINRHRWPTPAAMLKKLLPDLPIKLQEGNLGVPNAVTVDECIELFGMSREHAIGMLHRYSWKLLTDDKKSVLEEKDPARRHPMKDADSKDTCHEASIGVNSSKASSAMRAQASAKSQASATASAQLLTVPDPRPDTSIGVYSSKPSGNEEIPIRLRFERLEARMDTMSNSIQKLTGAMEQNHELLRKLTDAVETNCGQMVRVSV